MARQDAPRQSLAVIDVVAIVVGLVIGAGIFKTPAVVAQNAGSEPAMLLVWLAGGAISLAGALCYAELASAFPHTGGEYHFLTRAYGHRVGFLFAWSRLVVLQTGSIALLAFVLGDYLAQALPLGEHAPAYYAAFAVVALTALNIAGLETSKRAQNLLTLATVLGLATVIVAGLTVTPATAATETEPVAVDGAALGLAMIFVLLTYGGWNEAAYVSAELRGGGRGMARVLVTSIAVITVVYLLANLAYVNVLGLAAMSRSEVVTADAMRLAFGEEAALFVSALIAVAVVTSINVTIMTGARSSYAMARDFPLFGFLARWSPRPNAPTQALLAQGAVALLLVLAGGLARSGFETMVHYVSPVFWLFFLLTGLSLFVLRWREPARERPFRVPGYPYVPLLFVATCAYMLYSSVAYTGFGALLGVIVLAAGAPLLLLVGRPDVSRHEGDEP